MDFSHLYTGFRGRIRRSRFWLGAIILLDVWIVLMITIGILAPASSRRSAGFEWILPTLISLPLLYAWSALIVKRFQDRNRPGYFVAFLSIPVAVTFAGVAFLGGRKGFDATVAIFLVLYFAVPLWFLIELGFLRGSAGPNRYGPEPAPTPAPDDNDEQLQRRWQTLRTWRWGFWIVFLVFAVIFGMGRVVGTLPSFIYLGSLSGAIIAGILEREARQRRESFAGSTVAASG